MENIENPTSQKVRYLDKIVDELAAVQGKPADIGGYYILDPKKVTAVMRPSATFNAALESVKA